MRDLYMGVCLLYKNSQMRPEITRYVFNDSTMSICLFLKKIYIRISNKEHIPFLFTAADVE